MSPMIPPKRSQKFRVSKDSSVSQDRSVSSKKNGVNNAIRNPSNCCPPPFCIPMCVMPPMCCSLPPPCPPGMMPPSQQFPPQMMPTGMPAPPQMYQQPPNNYAQFNMQAFPQQSPQFFPPSGCCIQCVQPYGSPPQTYGNVPCPPGCIPHNDPYRNPNFTSTDGYRLSDWTQRMPSSEFEESPDGVPQQHLAMPPPPLPPKTPPKTPISTSPPRTPRRQTMDSETSTPPTPQADATVTVNVNEGKTVEVELEQRLGTPRPPTPLKLNTGTDPQAVPKIPFLGSPGPKPKIPFQFHKRKRSSGKVAKCCCPDQSYVTCCTDDCTSCSCCCPSSKTCCACHTPDEKKRWRR